MRILVVLSLSVLVLSSSALAGEFDETVWGSPSQGWEALTPFEIAPDSVVVGLSQIALTLNSQEAAPILLEIASMGPRPARAVDEAGYFAWNEELEKDVLQTKFGGGKWDWMTDYTPEPRAKADDWYLAFLQMRRLRLYEASGYKVIGIESVAYSDVGWRHLFLLVRE